MTPLLLGSTGDWALVSTTPPGSKDGLGVTLAPSTEEDQKGHEREAHLNQIHEMLTAVDEGRASRKRVRVRDPEGVCTSAERITVG